MRGYDVDPAELFAAAGQVRESARAGRAELARLRAQAADVLGASWRGGASAAFGAGWTEWLAGVGTVLSSLDLLAQALGDAGTAYARAEQASTQTFVRMAS